VGGSQWTRAARPDRRGDLGFTVVVTALSDQILPYLAEGARERLRSYFTSYGGRRFEALGGGGDRPETRDIFAADDVVAVSLLSVSIPPEAVLRILEPRTGLLGNLLGKIPHDTDLWTADRSVIGPGSDAEALWYALETIDGIGWVTAGKLLARKRPRLIPVYDSVVKGALMSGQGATWWVDLWEALQDEALVERLSELKAEADLDEGISLLRVLDVAAWMRSQ